MGRQHPSRNRGDVAPVVEYLDIPETDEVRSRLVVFCREQRYGKQRILRVMTLLCIELSSR
jgi:hypothetical protein